MFEFIFALILLVIAAGLFFMATARLVLLAVGTVLDYVS